MVMSVRDGAAGNRDQVRLLRAGQRLAVPRLALLGQHRIYPAFLEARADAHGRVAANIKGGTHLLQAPAFAQFQ